MPITIFPATLSHLEPLSALFNGYRNWYRQYDDLDGARNFLRERITNNESRIFIAYIDDQPAGFVQLYPIFTSVGMKKAWLLNDLFVDAGFRGTGVGTALLEQAKSFATETGSKWLMLQTETTNTGAQQLYERNGWQRISDVFYQFDL